MVKFGILGAGAIAGTFCDAVNGIQEHLHAVASRDLEKAEAFAKTHAIPKAYGSYEELLDDPEVTCVYVATPHAFHYEQMKMCIEKNKHILCEKAFTLNAAQAKEIFELADAKNLFVMEAMWTRFLPTILEVKKLVDEDVIGDIFQIDANFGFRADKKPKDRLFDPILGGGALLDIGIYPITLANLFLGIPDSFESNVTFHPSGVDLCEKIRYFYPEAEAVLTASFKEDLGTEATIYGTKGYVTFPGFHSAQVATVYNNNHKVVKMIEHKHLVNGMEYEVFETVKCIKKRCTESSIMSHETTLQMMRQMDEIRHSWNFRYPQELAENNN